MVDWELARNMAALRRNSLTKWPGMTIYTIGDTEHASGRSGHNPDDTVLPQGGTAELTDSDNDPEVRALDWMIGPHFTAADARSLVAALRDPRSLVRLYYIIYNRRIYRRDGSDSPYTASDPHTNHVHGSGWAGDDANGADWPAVLEIGQDMNTEQANQLAWTDARVEAMGEGYEGIASGRPGAGRPVWIVRQVKGIVVVLTAIRAEISAIKAGVAELVSRPPATSVAVDVAVVTAAMKTALQDPAVLAALAKAINDDHARRMEQ
jgi:hypothetical protein